jgi:methylated-DNA-[protein]-cysteine S-methyltransferase
LVAPDRVIVRQLRRCSPRRDADMVWFGMSAAGFTLFDTPVGRCALAWSERGVAGVSLPERSDDHMRARMRRRIPHAEEGLPPAAIAPAVAAIVAHLHGEARDLNGIELDMADVPEFHRRVYAVARTIARGETLTYGDIAKRLGEAKAAREVGQALGKNPFPIVVPCHRVVASGGKLGGFSAYGSVDTKLRLLALEGWKPDAPTLFDIGLQSPPPAGAQRG